VSFFFVALLGFYGFDGNACGSVLFALGKYIDGF